MREKWLVAASVVALAGVMQAGQADAGTITDTLYFTTYNSGNQDVWTTTATYSGNGTAGNGTFSPGTPTNLASTPGADGIVLNPNNNQLLVGGQSTGSIYQVNPAGGNQYTTLNAGMNAYEITVDPSGNYVWGGGSEGPTNTITKVPLNPTGGTPTVTQVTGSNTSVTHITFAPNLAPGTAYYTSGTNGGSGNFGTIDLATGVTTAILSNVSYAHGMVYDPFSGDLFVGGGNEIAQINPLTDAVVASITLGGSVQLDQGAVDGNGNLFWADNNGNMIYINYAASNKMLSASDYVYNSHFMSQLDDFAPLVGVGGTNTQVPEPATLALLGAGLAGLGFLRYRPRKVA